MNSICLTNSSAGILFPEEGAVQKVFEPQQADIVINWGHDEPQSGYLATLNRPAALHRLRHSESIRRILSMNSINSYQIGSDVRKEQRASDDWRSSNQRWNVRYRFHIVNLRLVGFQLAKRRETPRLYGGIGTKSKTLAKLLENAIRVVHLLGLDFAAVTFGRRSNGIHEVCYIETAPQLDRRLNRLYTAAFDRWVHRIIEQRRIPPLVKMGADPEFVLRHRDSGQMVLASRFFPYKGLVGCDARGFRGMRARRPLAELRPNPSTSPVVLTENIRRTMRVALRRAPYRNVEWVAGSLPFYGYPIGGHIHFTGIPLDSRLLRAFDNYLALPVLFLERESKAKGRRSKYGRLGDYRTKDHGGFEYRTLPSWLVRPEITQAVLTLAKIIAENFPLLPGDALLLPENQSAFYLADKAALRTLAQAHWQDIRDLVTSDDDLKVLRPLEQALHSSTSWDDGSDLRRNWKLRIPSAFWRVHPSSLP